VPTARSARAGGCTTRSFAIKRTFVAKTDTGVIQVTGQFGPSSLLVSVLASGRGAVYALVAGKGITPNPAEARVPAVKRWVVVGRVGYPRRSATLVVNVTAGTHAFVDTVRVCATPT
jgi:hypothetical protein